MAKKAELKTKVNDASVEGFLNSVADEQKRGDCFEILKLMKQATRCVKLKGVAFGSTNGEVL